MMICTIYSHQIGSDKIVASLKKVYPESKVTLSDEGESQIITAEIGGGFFRSGKKIKISYRQRHKPSWNLNQEDNCALTNNIRGLYGYVNSLPSTNEKVKDLFLEKIASINSEFSINEERGETAEITTLIKSLALTFDGVLFVQPNTPISKAAGQHFLDRDLNLILDTNGRCEIDDLMVKIDAAYLDEKVEISYEQQLRKKKNEDFITARKIKVNQNLPYIEDETEVRLRTPTEIAERVAVLAIVNMVAFNVTTGTEAIDYLTKQELWEATTPDEKDFLADHTPEKKSQETWKCECIWVLMWALNKVNDLGFPDVLCNLNDIPYSEYPVGEGKNPHDFINAPHIVRPVPEILDANDLYYRLNWACVDARINKQNIEGLHPGVVYERQYALNWLINYMDQEWDDVSCDT